MMNYEVFVAPMCVQILQKVMQNRDAVRLIVEDINLRGKVIELEPFSFGTCKVWPRDKSELRKYTRVFSE